MLASRQGKKALEFLNRLLHDGEEPLQMLGAITWMYRKLIEARELPPGTNQYQASRELNMRGDGAAIALAQARRIPREQLLAGISILAEADSVLKSGAPNPRATLEVAVARLTASPKTAVA